VRRAWLLGSIVALACDDGRSPLDFTQLDEPELACVETIHDHLELALALDGTIVAFVADAPASRGGWALLSTTLDGSDVLALVRVAASTSEPETAPIPVGIPFDAPRFELRAGAELGDAWLLRNVDAEGQGAMLLRRVRPGVGVVASNGSLANFPADSGDAECPHAWQRQLLLIEGRPYLLATPDCSEGPDLAFELLALEPDTLAFAINWSLAFDPCVGLAPELCAQAYSYRLVALVAGQSTHLAGASRVSIALAQTLGYDDQLDETAGADEGSVPALTTSVSRLDLRVTSQGPDARLLTIPDVWQHVGPLLLGSLQLGQDVAAQQLYVPVLDYPLQSVLLRIDSINDSYLAATSLVLPQGEALSLVQLDHASALAWLDQGRLRAAALDDVEVWGAFETRTLVDADVLGFESAGPGMLLVRRDDRTQVLHVACVE
jgi:hypothetical protein